MNSSHISEFRMAKPFRIIIIFGIFFFGAMAALSFALKHRMTEANLAGVEYFFLIATLCYVGYAFHACTIRYTCDELGISRDGGLGRSVKIPWSSIEEVRIAEPSEIQVRVMGRKTLTIEGGFLADGRLLLQAVADHVPADRTRRVGGTSAVQAMLKHWPRFLVILTAVTLAVGLRWQIWGPIGGGLGSGILAGAFMIREFTRLTANPAAKRSNLWLSMWSVSFFPMMILKDLYPRQPFLVILLGYTFANLAGMVLILAAYRRRARAYFDLPRPLLEEPPETVDKTR